MQRMLAAIVAGLSLLIVVAVPGKASIQGNYVEVRNADVYTGPCFASSQVDLEGKHAILVWKVTKGSWKGVDLNGLVVVAITRAKATLGDPYHDPYPAKSVLIVDQRANSQQRRALEEFAHSMAGKLLAHVVRVDTARINLKIGRGAQHGSVELVAGKLAQVKTRRLRASDIICGNEVVYYQPLVKLSHAMAAYTIESSFDGKGLGATWNLADERSAFVGTFTH